MRLYKVGTTWVDLDQIQGVSQIHEDVFKDNEYYLLLHSYGGPIRASFSGESADMIKYEVRKLLCEWSGVVPDKILLESIQIVNI